MMKHNIAKALLLFIVICACVSASPRLYVKAESSQTRYTDPETGNRVVIMDELDLLTSQEEEQLAEDMKPLTQYGNIAFWTTDQSAKDEIDQARIMRKNLFEYTSASIFVINMANRKLTIQSYGDMEDLLADENELKTDASETDEDKLSTGASEIDKDELSTGASETDEDELSTGTLEIDANGTAGVLGKHELSRISSMLEGKKLSLITIDHKDYIYLSNNFFPYIYIHVHNGCIYQFSVDRDDNDIRAILASMRYPDIPKTVAANNSKYERENVYYSTSNSKKSSGLCTAIGGFVYSFFLRAVITFILSYLSSDKHPFNRKPDTNTVGEKAV